MAAERASEPYGQRRPDLDELDLATDLRGTKLQGRAGRSGPRGVWAVALAVSIPHCLRGTRQDLPCTSAGDPAPVNQSVNET
jgi:hypothetical protein